MSKYKGENVLEVWDYRLSVAVPLIKRAGTWIVEVFAKDNPDYDPKKPESLAKPLESHDTGIPVERGDERDGKKVAQCYEWLHSVRDKYAREDIEELKPLVREVNRINAVLAEAIRGKPPSALVAALQTAIVAEEKAKAKEETE